MADKPTFLGDNTWPNITLFTALILSSAAHAYFTITFPTLSRELHIEDFDASLVMSLSAIAMMIASPLWGWLCERDGRKHALVIGLIASIISSIAISIVIYAQSMIGWASQSLLVLLITLRVIHTFFSSGIKPAAQAIMADLTIGSLRIKGMGMIGAAFGIGTIIGGFIALLCGSFYLIQGFLGVAALLSLSAVLLIVYFHETKTNTAVIRFSSLPFDRLWPYLLVTLIAVMMYSALQQTTAWRLQDHFLMPSHNAAQFNGAIMMATMLIMIITQSILVARLNVSLETLRLWGCLISTLALVLCALASSALLLLLSMLMLGLALGILIPSNLALLSLGVSENQQGQTAGLNAMFIGLGLVLGPVTGTWLYSTNGGLAYAVFAAAFALLSILTLMTKQSIKSH